VTYIGIALCAGTPFLLLFAEPVIAWLDRRGQQ
jgi:hypothetical protein